ncbi:hypothetical protein DOZ80_31425 [Pseudomonas fluorescens]|uniref:TIR domain-containing protein n=1 Tax=Pseudomonas fluorescens TaxID=294 RepID=A0A327MJ44_PSEFL|nr:toll/interleukin-1 receptor domain-containing protein [Pseudomonas fluorescens]RAI62153.1 hypothetical protein DOZ80_31425 [Pseudomonas fluorescens]
MYLGFEINDYRPLGPVLDSDIQRFKNQAKGQYQQLSAYLVGQVKGKDVIDADKIANHLFPTQDSHIFLSHSHADEVDAIRLAVSLEKKGLKVFVDSCVWEYFQNLVDDLNMQYSEPETTQGIIHYNYEKATQVSVSVHMMLVGALQAMIDRTETFIFLNTSNSAPLKNYERFDRTFSPWIYSELQFSQFAEQRFPERVSQEAGMVLDGIQERMFKSIARADMTMAYKAFNKHLPKVSGNDLKHWYAGLSDSGLKALDNLYRATNLVDEFKKARKAVGRDM